MDQKVASTIAVLATALVVNQRATVPDYSAANAHSAAATLQESAPKALSGGEGSATRCPAGESCDVLVPYRDTGPWVASCARAGTRGPPPARAAFVRLDGREPDRTGTDPGNWCLPRGALKPLIHFLVVTVPDPVSTHLALYFDRTIEAVEAAAQQHNYFLSRFWLPWPLPGEANAPSDTSGDLRVNAILNAYKRAQPGLLIFDRFCSTSDKLCRPDVTYTFLVSETPTSGINASQFRNATLYAQKLGNWERSLEEAGPVRARVVGPYFSGSVPSAIALAHEIVDNPDTGSLQVDFVSGTMTSREQAQTLRDDLGILGFSFNQTLHDDTRAQRFLLETLRERGLTRDGGNVAILQEDETRYGRSLNSSVPKPVPSPADEPFRRVRYIKFPRELSRLRNASSDDFGANPAMSDRSVTLPSDGISWNWKDVSKGEDSVPSFSGQQSPLSQQAVLLSISDVIRQENIKYVGISATDIFDILFLSKFLKLAAPNTRLFMLDADVLMVRTSSEGRELAGTLAVTTYPLFARNADWTSRYVVGEGKRGSGPGYQPSVDIFPSRMIEGIYNATLFALDPQDQSQPWREYVDPFSTQPPERNTRPPLWMTMVGRNGFWPVSVQSTEDTEPAAATPAASGPSMVAGPRAEMSPNPRDRLKFDPPDGTTLLLEGALLVWAVCHLLGLFFANRTGYSWLRQFQVRSLNNRQAHAQNQLHYLLCGTLALSAMLLLIAISCGCLMSNGEIAFSHPTCFSALFPLLYALIAVSGVLLLGWAVRIKLRINNSIVGWGYQLAAWTPYVLVLTCWLILSWGHDADRIFFAQRSFYLSNGVSPLLPVELLLLMFYIWAAVFIRKVRLSESKQVEVPCPSRLGDAGLGVEKDLSELKTATEGLAFNPSMTPLMVGGFTVGVILLLRPWEALASVEGRPYDYLIVPLVSFICLLITVAWGRYLFIWSRLRRILRAVERTPLRRAFSQLPKTYSWSQLWYEDAERRAYTLSARCLECFQAVVSCRGDRPEDRQALQEMTRAFKHVVRTDEGRHPDRFRAFVVGRLQQLFCREAERMLREGLVIEWAKEGGSESLEAEADRNRHAPLTQQEELRVLEEEFVALRYVSLIHFQSAQMKNLVLLLAVGFILALGAIGSYPFIAGRQCVWSLGALFLIFGAAIIGSFAQMDRDAIMSRLSGTDPGKLDLSFYLRVVSYGGLPLMALLASQFPSLGRSLFSWLEPALNAMH